MCRVEILPTRPGRGVTELTPPALCLSHHPSEGLTLSELNALMLVVALGLLKTRVCWGDRAPTGAVWSPTDPHHSAASPAPTGAALLPQRTVPLVHTGRALWFPEYDFSEWKQCSMIGAHHLREQLTWIPAPVCHKFPSIFPLCLGIKWKQLNPIYPCSFVMH